VAGRHEHVLPAVQEQDRDGDVGEVEVPRLEPAVVVPPSLAARRQPILRAEQKELVKLSVPDLEAASVGVSVDSISLAATSGDTARMSSRFLSCSFLAAALSVRNSRVSSTLSWYIPAK
jgi:hypothetical protein